MAARLVDSSRKMSWWRAGLLEVIDDSAVHAALVRLRAQLDKVGKPVGRRNPAAVEEAYVRAGMAFRHATEA
jgi:hypothetical protein